MGTKAGQSYDDRGAMFTQGQFAYNIRQLNDGVAVKLAGKGIP